MSQISSVRRLSLLPYQLRRLIYIYIGLGIMALFSVIVWSISAGIEDPLSMLYAFYASILFILAYGIYRLNSLPRNFSILVLGISAFLTGISIFQLVFGGISIILYTSFLGPIGYVLLFLQYFVFPLFIFYCLYLIANDDVKNYFLYPDMVENKKISPAKKKVETKEYRSFSSALDK